MINVKEKNEWYTCEIIRTLRDNQNNLWNMTDAIAFVSNLTGMSMNDIWDQVRNSHVYIDGVKWDFDRSISISERKEKLEQLPKNLIIPLSDILNGDDINVDDIEELGAHIFAYLTEHYGGNGVEAGVCGWCTLEDRE